MSPETTNGVLSYAEELANVCTQHATKEAEPALRRCIQTVVEALADGSSCVALESLPKGTGESEDSLRRTLLTSGVVGTGAPTDRALPLVLAADRLYLARFHRAEQNLGQALRARLSAPLLPVPPAAIAALQALPRSPGADGIDWQLVGIAAALCSPCSVITGGPGTGKTFTTARLLALLRHGNPNLRIALAAPTGKAGSRLSQAIAEHDPAAPAATTLHRLLEYSPLEDRFRHGPERPLPHDVVIVDEASMIDLELMTTLLLALRPEARLLLLGDRDQLASVGSGQVLADLCAAAEPRRGTGAHLRSFCRTHLGYDLPLQQPERPIANGIVELRQSRRFDEHSELGAFALALAQGTRDPERAAAVLERGGGNLRRMQPADMSAALDSLWQDLTACMHAESADAALAALDSARILCATREGPHSVQAANNAVEARLRREGLRTDNQHYRGRPILITQNDHAQGLYNGDLGVLWSAADQPVQAWFRTGKSELRSVLPQRLPQHETAWAMTVHKCQGSEFGRILLWLPDRPSPLCTAPLLYTAVTRARHDATIVATKEIVDRALRDQPVRASGLMSLLAGIGFSANGSS